MGLSFLAGSLTHCLCYNFTSSSAECHNETKNREKETEKFLRENIEIGPAAIHRLQVGKEESPHGEKSISKRGRRRGACRDSSRHLGTIGSIRDGDGIHGGTAAHSVKDSHGGIQIAATQVVGPAVFLPRNDLVNDVPGIQEASPKYLSGVSRNAVCPVVQEIGGVERGVVFQAAQAIDRGNAIRATPGQIGHVEPADPAGVVFVEPGPAVGHLDKAEIEARSGAPNGIVDVCDAGEVGDVVLPMIPGVGVSQSTAT